MLCPGRYRRGGKYDMDLIGWLSEQGLRRDDRRKDADPSVTYMPTYRAGWCDDQERDRGLRAARSTEERRLRVIEERALDLALKRFRGEIPPAAWEPRKKPGPKPMIPDCALGPTALALRMKRRDYWQKYKRQRKRKSDERSKRRLLRKLFEEEMARWSWPNVSREMAKEQTDNWFKRQRSPV